MVERISRVLPIHMRAWLSTCCAVLATQVLTSASWADCVVNTDNVSLSATGTSFFTGDPPHENTESLFIGDDAITVEDMAEWSDTIPYEVLTSITARVPRRYVG